MGTKGSSKPAPTPRPGGGAPLTENEEKKK